MTATVNVSEARKRLRELLRRAWAGEEIIIARAGRPVARLGPVETMDVRSTITAIKAERARRSKTTTAEILAARDKGRR